MYVLLEQNSFHLIKDRYSILIVKKLTKFDSKWSTIDAYKCMGIFYKGGL